VPHIPGKGGPEHQWWQAQTAEWLHKNEQPRRVKIEAFLTDENKAVQRQVFCETHQKGIIQTIIERPNISNNRFIFGQMNGTGVIAFKCIQSESLGNDMNIFPNG